MNIGVAGLSETLMSICQTTYHHYFICQWVGCKRLDATILRLPNDAASYIRRTELRLYPSGNLKTRITQIHDAEDKLESSMRSSGAV